MNKTIVIFGHGYVSRFLIQELIAMNFFVFCTSRKVELGEPVTNKNFTIINFLDPLLPSLIESANILLSTVPPNSEEVDPVLNQYSDTISKNVFEWIGYLSSTSVYGDHNGGWVDEETACSPSNAQSRLRLLAEKQWLSLYSQNKLPVHILRISAIYGPNRNCLEEIKNGKDFTVVKKDIFFSRVHVKDICMAAIASINSPTSGEIYNISDDMPAPINIVQQFGAAILNFPILKEIPFESSDLSERARCFFNDNKKVSCNKIKSKLKVSWIYSNYVVGLEKGCLPYLK